MTRETRERIEEHLGFARDYIIEAADELDLQDSTAALMMRAVRELWTVNEYVKEEPETEEVTPS